MKNFEKRHVSETNAFEREPCQPLLSQYLTTELRISNFSNLKFSENCEKKMKNIVFRKLQGFEQSILERRFAIPQISLTEPHCRDENFKFLFRLSKNGIFMLGVVFFIQSIFADRNSF